MYGLYSRAASNQERPMMARVRYVKKKDKSYRFLCLLSFILFYYLVLLAFVFKLNFVPITIVCYVKFTHERVFVGACD